MSICNDVVDLMSTYEAQMINQRENFGKRLIAFFKEKDPKTLMLFWINFSSYGVGMTEPVEDWIRRAGNKCKVLGYEILGEQLRKHAIHEANHELMMIEDTKKLISQWNMIYPSKLDAERILKRPLTDPVLRYQRLHEDYIESTEPYCQIAIEYEIENLSTNYGVDILNHTIAVLGKEIVGSLSFVEEHVRIDVAHTKYNKMAISNFMATYPNTLKALVEAGTKALEIYGDFFINCYQEAKVI